MRNLNPLLDIFLLIYLLSAFITIVGIYLKYKTHEDESFGEILPDLQRKTVIAAIIGLIFIPIINSLTALEVIRMIIPEDIDDVSN